jgi:hypothetical protein
MNERDSGVMFERGWRDYHTVHMSREDHQAEFRFHPEHLEILVGIRNHSWRTILEYCNPDFFDDLNWELNYVGSEFFRPETPTYPLLSQIANLSLDGVKV